MNKEQLAMLEQLQAYQFSSFDFVLYLDTHPNDQRALSDYSNLAKETGQLQKQYEDRFGPLTSDGSIGCSTWRWLEEPWPWEIEY
jgi:spore coat protein JB